MDFTLDWIQFVLIGSTMWSVIEKRLNKRNKKQIFRSCGQWIDTAVQNNRINGVHLYWLFFSYVHFCCEFHLLLLIETETNIKSYSIKFQVLHSTWKLQDIDTKTKIIIAICIYYSCAFVCIAHWIPSF